MALAANNGHSNVVTRLTALNANLNSPTKSQKTPLMMASTNGYLDVATTLLSAGARINLEDSKDRSALCVGSVQWTQSSDSIVAAERC